MKKKKKKLNIKRTIVFLLFLYIVGYMIYVVVTEPIKHIEISGNYYISDLEIIEVANIKNYPPIFKYTNKTLENKIKKLDLVEDVDVKKWFGFILKINVNENKILFYYQNTDKIVLSNGNIIDNNYKYLTGIPILVNTMESDILKKFIESFSKVDNDIISEINEIEYYPDYNSSGEVIDKNRFKIIMNDGNTVITDTNTCSILNKYNDIFASLGDKKGTLYLNDNLVFIPYEG